MDRGFVDSSKLGRKQSDHFDFALRNGVQEGLAILFYEHPIIKDYDNASVRASADEATDSLAEFEDGFGQGKFPKRVTPAGFDGFDPGFDKWMIGNRERQSGDNDIGQRLSWNVHAL